jgi:hypothetical protein
MILITLAGESSRFFTTGYNEVKYKLDYNGITIIENILNYIPKNESLIIGLNKRFRDYNFFKSVLIKLNFKNFQIIEINDTKGQLDTVFKVLSEAKVSLNDSLTVFNGDTIRKNYNWNFYDSDGVIEVFKGSGSHWSFIDKLGEVAFVKEKKRISNLCSNGLYYFKSVNLIIENYKNYNSNLEEIYISEFYNYLIKKGYKITGELIDKNDLVFCGTPKEYEIALKQLNDE